eukprot:2919142-Amphidinium_carterae.1
MNANGTPLPPLIRNPGPSVPAHLVAQNVLSISTGYEPNITQGLGRSGPYNHGPGGPGRIPVTPPAMAGLVPAVQVPVGGDAESDDFMDIGEPDNP